MKQQQMKRALLAALVSGMFLPLGVQAAVYRLRLSGHAFATQAAFRMA